MSKYENKNIAVVGYGLEGKSLVDFLIKKSPASITIIDEKQVDLSGEHKHQQVKLLIGSLTQLDLGGFDIIFRSPGVNPNKIKAPQDKITTLLNLFFEEKKGQTICVTGTKGKSTTVLLIEQILSTNGKKALVAGNIGKSPLDLLEGLQEDSYTVLELSSFQLMDFRGAPDFALILPLFPDHLDYHADENEYYQAKENIYKNSPSTVVLTAIVNKEILITDRNKTIYFSEQEIGDVFFDLNSTKQAQHISASAAKKFSLRHQIPMIDLVGAVALAEVLSLKVDLDEIGKNFKKLPLRIERVGEISGIVFYNDSASTNPISTLKAVSLIDSPMALILGGSSKGLDLEKFAKSLADNQQVKAIYLFGSVRNELMDILKKANYQGLLNTNEALSDVFSALSLENVKNVIFSPAFASFDQYKSYKERGEEFNRLFSQYRCQDI